MTNNKESHDAGMTLHRLLQWTSTILTGLLVAFVISGMETWDRLKEQSIRNESVPADIKEIKEDLSDVSSDVSNLKWKVTNLETNAKPRQR